MSAIAAGWLTLALLATADPTAAIRLLMLATAALALFVFGWVMTGLSQAVAQACQETAIIAALAARDPWLLAPFCAAIGLTALGFLRPRP